MLTGINVPIRIGDVTVMPGDVAIGDPEGVTDYAMTVPAADVVPALGQLATVGVITWT